jgi:pheromone shutdown protein TraB
MEVPDAEPAKLIIEPKIPKIFKNVTTLVSPFNNSTVHIVGVAHVSNDSANEVREVIREYQPNTVILELCQARISLLQLPEVLDDKPPSFYTCVKNMGMFAGLVQYYSQTVSQKLKIVPGIEQRAAFHEAQTIQGCQIMLGDRPLLATIQRTWASLSTFEKLKFAFYIAVQSFYDISEEDVEKMKETDLINSMIEELANHFPGMTRALLHERDEYLSCTLANAPGEVVVAIIGMGHVEGIKRNWGLKIDMDSLVQLPPPNPNTKYEVLFILYLIFQNIYIIYRIFKWAVWGL